MIFKAWVRNKFLCYKTQTTIKIRFCSSYNEISSKPSGNLGMLKKIDHHMLYTSNYRRRDTKEKAIHFRANSLGKPPIPSANHHQANYNHNYNKIGLKPLQDNSTTRISFKGFKVESIPSNLSKFMFKAIENISDEQKNLYSKFISEFIYEAKNNESFRKYIGLAADISKDLSADNLIKLPQKPLIKRFIEVIISPITMFKDLALWAADSKIGKKILPSFYGYIQERKKYDAIVKNYKNIIGLSNYIRIQENFYRLNAGLDPLKQGEKFLIPSDILQEKINMLRFKAVDPTKGQYSTKHMMLGNRFVSGAVYAGFLSNDAYNTTMRYSANEEASSEQGASRAKQEFAKIGMNIYVQNMLLGVFESQINKSMLNALLASGVTVAAAEVIGRMLVGRPIFPSNKETLDKMEEKMQNNTGVLATIGRLIAGDKRGKPQYDFSAPEPIVIVENNFFEHSITGINGEKTTFNKFSHKLMQPAFKGFGKTPYMFDREYLRKMLEYIKVLDPKQGKMFSEIVSNALQKIKKIGDVNIENKSLNEILNDNSIKQIPIGETISFTKRFFNGLLSPVFFIQRVFKSLFKGTKNLTGKKQEITPEMLQKEDFRKYLNERLELDVWKTSPLLPDEKEIKIYKEYLSRQSNQKFEINGIKNLILTLEKRMKILGIKSDSREAEHLNKAKQLLKEIMTQTDGVNHAEYDANTFSQLNINMARAISTIFLITDSYNLTMQYSNNDKKEAVKTAKNRAVQEASRIASSAYIMAFAHSIMAKIYNGTLLGAFATCFLTSATSDSLARTVVGVPIRRKSHDELVEIEKKQKESKNPVQKTLAYLIGKKTN